MTTIEGRTICPECSTDKSWVFIMDGEVSEQDVVDAVGRQNREVVEVNHLDHLDKLTRNWRMTGDPEPRNYA